MAQVRRPCPADTGAPRRVSPGCRVPAGLEMASVSRRASAGWREGGSVPGQHRACRAAIHPRPGSAATAPSLWPATGSGLEGRPCSSRWPRSSLAVAGPRAPACGFGRPLPGWPLRRVGACAHGAGRLASVLGADRRAWSPSSGSPSDVTEPEATAASPRKKRRRSRKQEPRREAAGAARADASRGEGQEGPAVPGGSPPPTANGRSPGDCAGEHRWGGARAGAGGERGARQAWRGPLHAPPKRSAGGFWTAAGGEARAILPAAPPPLACACLSGRPGAQPSGALEQGAGVRRGPGAAQTRVRSRLRQGRCGREGAGPPPPREPQRERRGWNLETAALPGPHSHCTGLRDPSVWVAFLCRRTQDTSLGPGRGESSPGSSRGAGRGRGGRRAPGPGLRHEFPLGHHFYNSDWEGTWVRFSDEGCGFRELSLG